MFIVQEADTALFATLLSHSTCENTNFWGTSTGQSPGLEQEETKPETAPKDGKLTQRMA